MASDPAIHAKRRIVRQAASLSSLAISDHEYHEGDAGELQSLLLEERELLKSVLKEGGVVRLIISPDTQVERVRLRVISRRFVQANILPRYDQLKAIITENLSNCNLQIVYVVRLPHDNLLIVGDSRVFIGRKRMRERGFPHTTLVYDPAIIREEIFEFDILFNDSAGVILERESPEADDCGSEGLKLKVINRLNESQEEIKRLLGRLPP
jgi:hypothetical protein